MMRLIACTPRLIPNLMPAQGCSDILNGSQGGQFAIYKVVDRYCGTGICLRGTIYSSGSD
jgi:hypothetical protein